MKKITYLLTAFLILGISSCQCPKSSDQTTPNLIRTAIPERPAGQTDVIGLRCAPLDTVRVGFIGLGMRGPGPSIVLPKSKVPPSKPSVTFIPNG